MSTLTAEQAARAVRDNIFVIGRRQPLYTEEALLKCLDDFGGVKVLTASSAKAELKELRRAFFSHPNFPHELTKTMLLAISKLSGDDIGALTHHKFVYEDSEVFNKICNQRPTETLETLFWVSNREMLDAPDWLKSNLWERLPKVHAETCTAGPEDYCRCEQITLTDPVRYKTWLQGFKASFMATLSPEALDALEFHFPLMGMSAYTRMRYAGSIFVHDSRWLDLAHDTNRDVLNNLVENLFLPEELAEMLAFKHKTPRIREKIAERTTNLGLLDKIHGSTKSESIRKAVEHNVVYRKAMGIS